MAFLAGSRYQFPESVKEYFHQELEDEYSSANALIRLKKTKDYCLSSVQSPRTDGWERWKNIREDETAETDSHEFTKSLNESFHGTNLFAPGTYGYQQHMWTAALSEQAVLFVNHPGTTAEKSGMRPGYWFGNGLMGSEKEYGSFEAFRKEAKALEPSYDASARCLYTAKDSFSYTKGNDWTQFVE